MQTSQQNNKRIAKNTLLLYVRMFFVVIVGLYTSRVVLNTLGVSDYGIYNVVGGIVTVLSFLNSGMVTSSQRFISYWLGKGDEEKLSVVFSTSVNIHAAIAIIIFVAAETIGLWFVNTHLNIEMGRMSAANWVYQLSVFSFMVSIMSVPYNSCIVAHEHMNAFAYISILEIFLKLGIVFLLLVVENDKLIVYAILVFCVSLFIRFCYTLYCRHHFRECKYHLIYDKSLCRSMFSFAGWSVVGNLGFSFKDQGSNIILNMFFGTAVNAARGVAMQVSGIINTFSSNFAMSMNPQITKQYAAGEIQRCLNLVYVGARLSFFLLSIVSIPFIINSDYILNLWLGLVPLYTKEFIVLSLLQTLLYTLSGTTSVALQARGEIKTFQIGVCVIMLSELPIAYILMRLGMPPYFAMYPGILTNIIAVFFRLYLLKKGINECNVRYYVFNVFLRSIVLFSACWILCDYIHSLFSEDFKSVVTTVVISIFVITVIFYVFGLNKAEKCFCREKSIALVKRKTAFFRQR